MSQCIILTCVKSLTHLTPLDTSHILTITRDLTIWHPHISLFHSHTIHHHMHHPYTPSKSHTSPLHKNLTIHSLQPHKFSLSKHNGGFFGYFLFMLDIQHCFICRTADSTVSEDAVNEPRTVATIRHWLSDALTTWLDRIHKNRLDLIHYSARSHPHSELWYTSFIFLSI